MLEGFCTALVDAGVPLWRLNVGAPAIDPSIRGFDFNWQAGEGTSTVPAFHGAEAEAGFKLSPVYALLTDGRTYARWRLDGAPSDQDFPLLAKLKTLGGTDYVLHMIGFAPGTALVGVAVSFASDTADGFSDDHLAVLADVLPAFGLASCKLSLSRTLRETLATYLGPAAGARVLEGQITRGHGQTVSAAILLADLRAFTTLTDRDDPLRVVGWLDEHLDALGGPVAEHGGEILKFMGDGFLAIFPVSDLAAGPCGVCEDALRAAEKALMANHQLNRSRAAAGLPILEADLVLHFGDVVYGNVGTRRRLDFTVIGRAVNEASRIEKLCDSLDRSLLLSDSFAERCGRDLLPLGAFPLRGLEHPRRLWTTFPAAEKDGSDL